MTRIIYNCSGLQQDVCRESCCVGCGVCICGGFAFQKAWSSKKKWFCRAWTDDWTLQPDWTAQLTYSDFFCRLLVDASFRPVNCCCRLPARPGLPRLPVLSATARLLFVRDPLPVVERMCGWISNRETSLLGEWLRLNRPDYSPSFGTFSSSMSIGLMCSSLMFSTSDDGLIEVSIRLSSWSDSSISRVIGR